MARATTVKDLRGGDQSGMRAYNRRMILNLIRQSGALPKAEIARATGLSAQSVSVIVNDLLRDRLVRKEKKVRGKVGQPYTPISLDPDGALSIGIKIGRRSLEIALVNFTGGVLNHVSVDYDAPRRREVVPALEAELAKLLGGIDPARRARIVGAGIAMPGQISDWTEEIGLAPHELDDWADFDARARIAELTGLPVEVHNDATAACAAEMQLGEAVTRSSVLYIYIGTFIGGGIVLDGRLYDGAQNNAGAIGSMPVLRTSPDRKPRQLIRYPSLVVLEHALAEAGFTGFQHVAEAASQPGAEPVVARWRNEAADSIAHAITCAASIIDFQSVVIDAMLPHAEVEAITAAVRESLDSFDWTGLSPLDVHPGSIGPLARVVGAALLPLIRHFSPDQELLVKRQVA